MPLRDNTYILMKYLVNRDLIIKENSIYKSNPFLKYKLGDIHTFNSTSFVDNKMSSNFGSVNNNRLW